METIGFVFGISGLSFGLIGFVFGISSANSAALTAGRVDALEQRLSDAGILELDDQTGQLD